MKTAADLMVSGCFHISVYGALAALWPNLCPADVHTHIHQPVDGSKNEQKNSGPIAAPGFLAVPNCQQKENGQQGNRGYIMDNVVIRQDKIPIKLLIFVAVLETGNGGCTQAYSP